MSSEEAVDRLGHRFGRGNEEEFPKGSGFGRQPCCLQGFPIDLIGFYALDRAFWETKRFRLRKAAGLSMARRALSPSISVENHGSFITRRKSCVQSGVKREKCYAGYSAVMAR